MEGLGTQGGWWMGGPTFASDKTGETVEQDQEGIVLCIKHHKILAYLIFS